MLPQISIFNEGSFLRMTSSKLNISCPRLLPEGTQGFLGLQVNLGEGRLCL
jgi:hypothetical protein